MDLYKIGNNIREDVFPKSGEFLYYTDDLGNILITSNGDKIGEVYVPEVFEFVAVFDTALSVTDRTIVLPYSGGNFTDWGDGNTSVSNTHVYSSNGIYEIKIVDDILGWSFSENEGDKNALIEIKSWNNLIFGPTSFKAFLGCANLVKIPVDQAPVIDGLVDFSYMFWNCMFEEINLNLFDMSNVNNTTGMFDDCSQLKIVHAENCETGNVTHFSYMFSGCSSITDIQIESWDTHSGVRFNFMFDSFGDNLATLDLSSWNMRNATSVAGMLRKSSINEIIIDSWSLESISPYSYMRGLFEECSATTISCENVYIGPSDMQKVFKNCLNLTTIKTSNMEMENVRDIRYLCLGSVNLKNIGMSSWNIPQLTYGADAFLNVTLDTIDYSEALINFASQTVKPNVIFNFGGSKYNTSAQASRDTLTNTYGWIIFDGGPE